MFDNLDEKCPHCQKPIGDHTLREWDACTGNSYFELPAEDVPEDITAQTNEAMRQRFNLDPGTVVADNVTVFGAGLEGTGGPLAFKKPAVLMEFGISQLTAPPLTVAKVVFVADHPEGARAFGRLVRDNANRAANKIERE